jgi:hypothetical protein
MLRRNSVVAFVVLVAAVAVGGVVIHLQNRPQVPVDPSSTQSAMEHGIRRQVNATGTMTSDSFRWIVSQLGGNPRISPGYRMLLFINLSKITSPTSEQHEVMLRLAMRALSTDSSLQNADSAKIGAAILARKLRDRRAIPALTPSLNSSSPMLRSQARLALAEMGYRPKP